jgi:phenylacetate-coenzyme A ligase PaaK-like adenylate-forming protein
MDRRIREVGRELALGRFVQPGPYRDVAEIYPLVMAALLRERDAHLLRAFTTRRLRRLLGHAAEVPYYRSLGVDADTVDPWACLGSLPPLRRVDVERAGTDLWRGEDASNGALTRRTGGTTAHPQAFLRPVRESAVIHSVATIRRNAAWRMRRPQTMLFFSRAEGVGSFIAYHQGFHRYVLADPTEALDAVVRARPAVVFAHPDQLRRLGSELPGAATEYLHCFVSYGNVMDLATRRLLQERGYRVLDLYSQSELTTNTAWECPSSGLLHVNDDYLHVEVLVGERPAAEGELGRLVVTDLTNPLMPLLRYETGDLVARGPACPCGRVLTTLHGVYGRVGETIGRHGMPVRILLDALGITGVGDLDVISADRVTLRWRQGAAPEPRMREEIRLRAERILGIPVDTTTVDQLSRTGSCKFRLVNRAV